MSTIFRIPMNEETRVELEDCFIDVPNMDARKFSFDNLKMACQDAKRSFRNKITPINQRQKDGSMKQVEFSLKDIDLEKYTLDSSPNWIPKGMDKEDYKPIELKLGDNTMSYLRKYGQLIIVRHEQFNISEEKYLDETRAQMKLNNTPKENVKQWEKSQEKIRKERLDVVPTCLEQAIFVSIWPLVQQKLEQSDNTIFDKEYNEMYPTEPEQKVAQ